MEHVIVERVFAEPVELEALTRSKSANQACFSSRRITHVRSFLSRDRRRLICEYMAPDAESVRKANELAQLPFERIWTAQVIASADL